jgi:hypothetical protein
MNSNSITFCKILDELIYQDGTQPNSTENIYVDVMKKIIYMIKMIIRDLYETITPDA